MGGADSIWKLYRKVSVQIFTVDINEKCNIIQNSEKGVGLLHRCQFMCEYLMIFSVEARKQTLGQFHPGGSSHQSQLHHLYQ